MFTSLRKASMLDIFANVGAVITGLGAAWIVWLGHQLARRQRADAWLENLNELHGLFWEDSDFVQVREWLISDSAYKDLQAALEVRFLRPEQMDRAEYRCIEVLDKFLNFLIRVRVVDSQLEEERDLWSELSFSFWMESVTTHRRWHLLVYIDHFFGGTQLGSLLSMPVTPETSAELAEVRARLLPAAPNSQ
ncbi:MAG: hypothetical protein JSU98_15805 [Gemmatimonadales bacterium]|nr:MAG: hypothetical protein JSU98_15805 [Gemmatimonadales bacterium]